LTKGFNCIIVVIHLLVGDEIMFRFNIDFSSPVAIYQQIILGVKLEILAGRLRHSDRLPPIRELAKILKLNPNTVAKAYYTLENEGFIKSKRGSGSWVNTKNIKLDSLRIGMIEAEFKAFLEKAISLGAAKGNIKNLIKRYLDNE